MAKREVGLHDAAGTMVCMLTANPGDLALLRILYLLPRDGPFSTAGARDHGVNAKSLRALVTSGLLTHPMRGVYYDSVLPDSLEIRLACLRLVVPARCVVTDRTAAWLWGAERVLAPGDHLVTPNVSVFCPPGHRLRNELSSSGERAVRPGDVMELDGVRVTSPLRTACDLGRLLHRDQAFATMDALARTGRVSVEEIVQESGRFKGYRGVVQLRELAPFVDPDSESPGESILRRRWLDVGLPRPQCQVPVDKPDGGYYYVDIGLPDDLFGAEYDGEDFHPEERAEHDELRRCWMREGRDWVIVVARKDNVHGREQDIDAMLLQGALDARIRF